MDHHFETSKKRKKRERKKKQKQFNTHQSRLLAPRRDLSSPLTSHQTSIQATKATGDRPVNQSATRIPDGTSRETPTDLPSASFGSFLPVAHFTSLTRLQANSHASTVKQPTVYLGTQQAPAAPVVSARGRPRFFLSFHTLRCSATLAFST